MRIILAHLRAGRKGRVELVVDGPAALADDGSRTTVVASKIRRRQLRLERRPFGVTLNGVLGCVLTASAPVLQEQRKGRQANATQSRMCAASRKRDRRLGQQCGRGKGRGVQPARDAQCEFNALETGWSGPKCSRNRVLNCRAQLFQRLPSSSRPPGGTACGRADGLGLRRVLGRVVAVSRISNSGVQERESLLLDEAVDTGQSKEA